MGIHHFIEKSSKTGRKMAGQKRKQRTRKPVSPQVQEARDDRRKERNRAAAKRCRDKRENQVKVLEDQKADLMFRNDQVSKDNEAMRAEIQRLKILLGPEVEETMNNNGPEMQLDDTMLTNPDQYLMATEFEPIFAECF